MSETDPAHGSPQWSALHDIARITSELAPATQIAERLRSAAMPTQQMLDVLQAHARQAREQQALLAATLPAWVRDTGRIHELSPNLTDAARQLQSIQTLPPDLIQQLRGSYATGVVERIFGDDFRRVMGGISGLNEALAAAGKAFSFALPSALEAFRTQESVLAAKLLGTQMAPWWGQNERLSIFGQTSAFADLVSSAAGVSANFKSALDQFSRSALPGFANLQEYRSFLDAAGLSLPRVPRARLLTTSERRKRLKAKLRANVEPKHVRRAKSLVHQYELTLREIIDSAMTAFFGDDWPYHRLPLCDCKDLLGKWEKHGGDVLHHADYHHYKQIMSHPHHFEAIFAAAFDDPQTVVDLVSKAARLRAASHHARIFTEEDLRDLRVTWRAIETGLIALTPKYSIEWSH